jgi:ABC-type lipoprotein release transport system permease subunit
MRRLLDVSLTGLVAVSRSPLRSLTCVAALVVVLAPYLAGVGLAQGVEAEAEASVRHGADLYVRGSQFGRPAPLPLLAVKEVAAVHPGVYRVVPRIVGEVFLGKEQLRCVLVGMPPRDFPDWANCIEGKPPSDGGAHQLVIGTTLARRLGLKVGSRLPPFYRNRRGERISQVVGIFAPEAPLWQAHLILTTFDSAAAVFDQPGLATDLLVNCEAGTAADVAREITQQLSFPSAEGQGVVRPEVVSSEELLATLPLGVRRHEAAFNLHFVLAFCVAILVLLVTSGLGLTERRREIGILKATGWQTDEVLLRGAVESAALSLAGAGASFLLAWAWLRLFNACGIAALFVTGADVWPDFPMPYRLTPVPLLLGLVFSLVIVLSGTLFSVWRSAIAPPREAMR